MAPSFAITNAFLLFAAGALSFPTLYERDTSLACPTSDGTTFTATSGAKFTVQCNTDHYGGDLSMVWTDNLDECIDSCDGTTSCVTVAWVGPTRGPCYMKSSLQPGVSNDAVWGAVLQSSMSSSNPSTSASPTPSSKPSAASHVCPSADASTITAPSGTKWLVECGIDHFGGDLSNQLTNSFDDCIALCDSTTGCLDVAWNGPAPGTCYMKNSVEPGVSNAGIWGAKLLSATSSSSSSSSAAATTPTSTPHTCPSADGATVGNYVVQCFVDHYGGDMGTVTADTLDDCFSACDTTAGCQVVSWVSPDRCYLKNSVQAGHADSGVWGGQLLSTLPTSTTSLSPSLTGSPVSNPSLGSGTEAIFNGPVTIGTSAPVATLTPLPPIGVDMGAAGVLTPDPTSQLWYGTGNSSSNDSASGTYIRLNITFAYPSIVLDDSIYIQDITCAGGVLTASFDNPTAFSFAESTWPTGSDVILITAASSCGENGQNAFFLATSISFSGDSISATGSVVELADVFSNMDLDFGEIEVDNSSLNGTLSNSTTPLWSNSTSGYGCDAPGSSEIDGLPAISCGPTFDHDLDTFLGFYSGDDADTQNVTMTIAPGLKYPSSGLVSRCWCCCSIIHAVQSVVHTVVAAVAPIVHVVVKVIAPIVHVAVAAVSNVAKAVAATVGNIASAVVALAKFVVTGNYSRSFSIQMNMGPPALLLTESPWGPAFKFYSFTRDPKDSHYSLEKNVVEKISEVTIGQADPEPGIDLFCVNCGLKGNIQATGSISATPLSGFTKGQISMTGNLYAGLFIGLDAFAEWDVKAEKTLFVMGLPGFSIPDIVDLGPTLSLGISADLDIQAEGQYLVGASMTWSSISATLDFFDKSKSSQSGFTPVVDHTIQSEGTLTVTSTLGLPVTLGFGINILNGKWDKEVKLIDTPGIAATLEYDDDISYIKGELDTTPANGCYGITWDVGFVNQLQLDLSDFDGPTFTLSQWNGAPLAEGCIGQPVFSALPSSTPTSSSSTSSSPTPTPTPTYPPKILSFNYGGSDQTTTARSTFINDQDIYVNTNQMVPWAGGPFYDPWGGNPKTIAMLYEYGTDMRIFVSGDGQGAFTLSPTDTNRELTGFPVPAGTNFQILAVVWGLAEIRDPAVYQKLYTAAAIGSYISWTNAFFNKDTWVGVVKSGVVWYKDASGTIRYLTGRENTYSSWSNALKRDIAPEPQSQSIAKQASSVPPLRRRLLSTRQDDLSVYSNSTTSNSTSNSTDTFAPVTIKDTTGTLLLSPSNNGSLFVSLANSTTDLSTITNNIQFAADTESNTVFGDSASRLLHYFPSTMTKVGASRLRLAGWGSIPVGAQIVNLVPFTAGSDTVLVAVDTLSNYYWPFVCAVQGQLNKVFLVNDASNGANVLEDPDLMYIVVGGVASNCAPLALTATGLTGFDASNSTTTSTELRRTRF